MSKMAELSAEADQARAPENPRCLKCGEYTIFVREYAKNHFSFFCGKCNEWRYIP
jgi:formylmethanofuran dehydrogenase subunit E